MKSTWEGELHPYPHIVKHFGKSIFLFFLLYLAAQLPFSSTSVHQLVLTEGC